MFNNYTLKDLVIYCLIALAAGFISAEVQADELQDAQSTALTCTVASTLIAMADDDAHYKAEAIWWGNMTVALHGGDKEFVDRLGTSMAKKVMRALTDGRLSDSAVYSEAEKCFDIRTRIEKTFRDKVEAAPEPEPSRCDTIECLDS